MAYAGQTFGALAASYLLLRLLMYGHRKLRQKPNEAVNIAAMGLLALGVATIVGGYGLQDYAPEPLFLNAFATYFGPVMAVTVIELVRFHRV